MATKELRAALSLEDLGFKGSTVTYLRHWGGIETVEDLAKTPIRCLGSVTQFGKRRIADAVAVAERAGVILSAEPTCEPCRCPVCERRARQEADWQEERRRTHGISPSALSLEDLGLEKFTIDCISYLINSDEELFRTPLSCLQGVRLFGKKKGADVLAAAARAGVTLPSGGSDPESCTCPIHATQRRWKAEEEARLEAARWGIAGPGARDIIDLAKRAAAAGETFAKRTETAEAKVLAWSKWYDSGRTAPPPQESAADRLDAIEKRRASLPDPVVPSDIDDRFRDLLDDPGGAQ
jgi:hypothetical protein